MSMTSVTEANAYFTAKLHNRVWLAATQSRKQAALNEAAIIINQFNYLGTKTSASQENEFPRSNLYDSEGNAIDDSTIPNDIKRAEWEIAYALLQGYEPERDVRGSFVTSRGYSSVRSAYDTDKVPEHLKVGVPSALAWSCLSGYVERNASGSINLYRV